MLYEIERVRRFTGIRCSNVPDETTILNFHHLPLSTARVAVGQTPPNQSRPSTASVLGVDHMEVLANGAPGGRGGCDRLHQCH